MQRDARGVACAVLFALAPSASLGAELLVEWVRLAAALDGYQVERRVNSPGAPFKPIARVDAFETSFRDREVQVGVLYCYRVRGVRGEQVSPPSPELCSAATEPAQKPLPKPAMVAVQPAPRPAAQPAPRGEDREVKALRRPPPVYPRDAQLRGLSGWVRLRFTVTSLGSTSDIQVLESDPPGVFDQAAIDSARRFVYAPRLENGVAVDRKGVETDVSFTWIQRGGDLVSGRRPPGPH